MERLEPLVLKLLEAAGAKAQAVEDGKAYTAPVSPELAPLFQGRKRLYFTFDEEYFDLHQERGVEFVAPGYPLLDRLIRYAQTRFLVSEAALDGTGLRRLGLSSHTLALEAQPRMVGRIYLCFHLKLTLRSDEHVEELLTVWVDLNRQHVLSEPPQGVGLRPTTQVVGLDAAKVQAAWVLAQQEAQEQIRVRVARYEEAANLRLVAELRRLDQARVSAVERQRAIERHRLQVHTELVFTEILHYPLQLWEVELRGRAWNRRYQFRWDAVRKTWLTPPSCPVCQQPTSALEACDAGQHPVCPSCAATCTHCQARHCSAHPTRSCHNCRQGHCPQCLTNCHSCARPYCPRCLEPCPACTKSTCENCLLRCAVCDHAACKNHFARCHLSGAALCPEHAHACANCGQTTHPARLHPAGDKGKPHCEACAMTCSEAHPEPYWIPRRQAMYCAAPHDHPHVLCPQHVHRCVLHPTPVAFCAAHLEACSSCGAAVCSEHRAYSALSGQLFCSAHLFQCPRCRRTVGTPEKVAVTDGPEVCPTCAQACPSCAPQHLPWNLDQLLPCPHCLSEGLQQKLVTPQPSPDQLKRSYPNLLRCPEHRVTCYLCGRPGCTDHVRGCPECRRPTCPTDLVRTVEGDLVCRACGYRCKDCAPEHLYLRSSLEDCTICRQNLCPEHRTACRSCLEAACAEHTRSCRLCKEAVCTRCAQDGYCQACASLCLGQTLPSRLPLSTPAQAYPYLLGSHLRPDGTRLIHVVYYPEVSGFWQRARLLLTPPLPRLDVLEERGGQMNRLRTRVLSKGHPSLPRFNAWSYLFRRAQR